MMEATSGLYGVEFSSSENFKEEFVARIVQLAIGRYGLAPITFFAAYNGVDEDFDSNCQSLPPIVLAHDTEGACCKAL